MLSERVLASSHRPGTKSIPRAKQNVALHC